MHEVKFSLPERELGKSDVEFKIKKNGRRFGTLRISKGAIVWIRKDASYGNKISWSDFDEFMKDKPRLEKR